MGAWVFQNERLVQVPLGEGKALTVEQSLDAPIPHEADGTNLRVWPTACVFANYIAAHPELVAGKRIVELGSGSGTVGLVCAALGARKVVITDQPEALTLIRDNVKRNAEQLRGSDVAVLPCTWGDQTHIAALLEATGGEFDVVVACEVVYKQSEAVLHALADTQQQLMAQTSGVSLLAYEYRGELFDDLAYFDAANERFEVEPRSLRDFEGELLDDEYGDEDGRWVYTHTHKPADGDATGAQRGGLSTPHELHGDE